MTAKVKPAGQQGAWILLGFLAGLVLTSIFAGREEIKSTLVSAAGGGGLPKDLILHVYPDAGSDSKPARRRDYKYETTEYQNIYDATWTQGGYPAQSCWGCRFAGDLVSKVAFHSVLDAGTGNGQMVRTLRKYGKSAWGIELSDAVLKQECPDLLEAGIVESGVLTNLPYADNSFDMVFSADVLEHIHPEEAEKVIAELVRVTRRHLFLSISLKGHTKVSSGDDAEANRHTMLRPRTWWERRFAAHGVRVNTELLWAMQQKDASYGPDDLTDCRLEGDDEAGGQYQVCVVENTWLVGVPKQENVRRDRCMTPENFELEPWFFAFRKPCIACQDAQN